MCHKVGTNRHSFVHRWLLGLWHRNNWVKAIFLMRLFWGMNFVLVSHTLFNKVSSQCVSVPSAPPHSPAVLLWDHWILRGLTTACSPTSHCTPTWTNWFLFFFFVLVLPLYFHSIEYQLILHFLHSILKNTSCNNNFYFVPILSSSAESWFKWWCVYLYLDQHAYIFGILTFESLTWSDHAVGKTDSCQQVRIPVLTCCGYCCLANLKQERK